tara:strand:+ start:29 stop:754 length:726 start_codon:yes stop_codon:yes gene_type:complete
MRQIFLDTETTGLNHKSGDRIIEIGCVELNNRRVTGKNFQKYLNPGRESDPGALAVHGLTSDFLKDKPKFSEIVDSFLDFIKGSELIIHNAPFDIGFLNSELDKIGFLNIHEYITKLTDTLLLAKDLHPGKRNSLDALCDRYKVDNRKRKLHGALLDSELLAEVYLLMTRGQESLTIELNEGLDDIFEAQKLDIRQKIHRVRLNESDIYLHEEIIKNIELETNDETIWTKIEKTNFQKKDF